MTWEALHHRLSKISTSWTLFRQAHSDSPEAAVAARQRLIERYDKAIRRYLLGALHDAHAADDLAQEFAVCLLSGELHAAAPERGRFRNYIRAVLSHLLAKYRTRQQKAGITLAPDHPELADLIAPAEELDRQLNEVLREDLLARAWQALAEAHPTFHTVLHIRTTHARMASPQLAEELSRQLGKSFSAVGARQAVHRARELHADLLIDDVAQSLAEPTLEHILEELRDLNLLDYCRPALERYKHGKPGR